MKIEKIVSSEPIFLKKSDLKNASNWLQKMVLIRELENKLAKEKKNGVIKGPVHLAAGQEAISVGISDNISFDECVFGAHRSHAHILSLGCDIKKLFAEILGRETGLSKGMGGSMHLIDKSVGFYGSVPIVAGTVSIALGAALGKKLKKEKGFAISYLGDGAIEEGVVHESLNFASSFKIPILFVLENNLFSSHMHISQRQPNSFTSRFAEANKITYEIIDGNNVLEVFKTSKRLIKFIRDGNGPAFIEAFTHRKYGHVDWREDIDVGVNRSKEDLEIWKTKDPILRLEKSLLESNFLSNDEIENIKGEIKLLIEEKWKSALKDPYPPTSSIYEKVYSSE